MSEKILIIGNSHLAALKLALDQNLVLLDENLKIDFLGMEGNELLPNLDIDNGHLLTKNEKVKTIFQSLSNEVDSLLLSSYSRIIVYGCQLLSIGNGANWIGLVNDSEHFFSHEARKTAFLDQLYSTSHYQFLSRINDESTISKVISIPSPFPSELHPLFDIVNKWNDESIHAYLRLVENEIKKLGVAYLEIQPLIASSDWWFATDKSLKTKIDGDVSHINAAGGARILNAVLGHIHSESTK